MAQSRIRRATLADREAVEGIVNEAYCHYVPRMGTPPGPMLDDYAARMADGAVFVIETDGTVCGIIVLIPRTDHLLLDTIAVAPRHQGEGLGRRLLAFAEEQASAQGFQEVRLYTHEKMVENVRLYTAFGYDETNRAVQAGYDRVFMRKRLP